MSLRTLLLSALLLAAAGPATASAAPEWVGFNDLSSVAGRTPFDAAAQRAVDAGASSTRVIVDWSWIEYAPEQYAWGMLDGAYWADLKRGVRPLIGVTGAPRWAWPSDATCPADQQCPYPPGREYDGAYQSFIRQLVRRYPRAAAIQVGNEPNLGWAWAGGVDPARYTELLKLAYDAVKSVDPAMPVVAAGLAPVAGEVNTADAMGLRRYLQAMYDNGARGHMDALAVHPYPRSVSFSSAFQALSTVKDVRAANGDTVPLWITEFGLTTTDFDAYRQGIAVPALYDALRGDPDVQALYVHTLYDDPTNGEASERGYGLLGPDGTPKPAFCNIARANGSAWTCPATIAAANPSAAQSARWKAQVLLQTAADAARRYRVRTGSYTGLTTAALNALDPRIRKEGTAGATLPDINADPSKIAIFPLDASGMILCNASTAGVTYCYGTKWNVRWVYASGTGSIVSTAIALMTGTSTSWS